MKLKILCLRSRFEPQIPKLAMTELLPVEKKHFFIKMMIVLWLRSTVHSIY
jgi:hypothetical protein